MTEDDVLEFVRACVVGNRILWTYHANMRLRSRNASRKQVTATTGSYRLLEYRSRVLHHTIYPVRSSTLSIWDKSFIYSLHWIAMAATFVSSPCTVPTGIGGTMISCGGDGHDLSYLRRRNAGHEFGHAV